MNYLITGGAGFLGRRLANKLVETGHNVRVIDDLSTGEKEALDSRVLFTRGDVRDQPKLWTLLHDIDVVYHLAAKVSLPQSVLYPREYNDVNVSGTVTLMEAMRALGTPRIVLASSGTIYGDQKRQPVDEQVPPDLRTPYAVSKLASEHYIFTLGRHYGIEAVALRIFNAYGPGQSLPPAYPPVVPQFLNRIMLGGSLVVFGSGKQTRDYVYVEDVVDALMAAGEQPHLDGEVINIGSGVETSVNDLIELIEEVTGRQAHVLFNQKQSGGVQRLVADIEKAGRLLDYRPQWSLAEGLRETIHLDMRFRELTPGA
ncbi:MAG TPA: NAD-dependent epimerase/dehydratase family protein [Anaerolineae bacterium]|nr:NAD-dependent epimerase/dehydratase family protein [Anaerolineae bacterium]HIQ12616.1 NAD-dependent epimerase/dehydratase family protein [Caldilineales bacterium]